MLCAWVAKQSGVRAVLEEEIRFYEENLPDWLQRHEARVVLVKGRELIGFFDTEGDAIEEGARLFGLTSFLVRRVLPTQPLVYVPALVHGVLSADLQQSGNDSDPDS
jgi:hypothetical protein